MPTSGVGKLGVASTVSGRESQSMAVCCREAVDVELRLVVPQKKFRVTGVHMPNAELVSIHIR